MFRPPLWRALANPYLLLTLTTLFWGANVVVGRAVTGAEMPPVALSFWRWALAAAILLPFAGPSLWRQRDLVFKHWPILLVLSVTGVAIFNTLLYLALTMTTAVNASLIQGFLPALTVLVSWILLRQGTTLRAIAGMAVSMVGVVVVISRGDVAALFGLGANLGDLLMLPAMAAWALYNVLLRFRPTGLDPFAFILLTFLVGLVFVGGAYAIELAAGKTFALNGATGGAIAYVALFPALLAYIFWNRGVQAVGANAASQFHYLMPLWGSLLAVILLGEAFRLFHLAGIVLIFGGVYLATSTRRANRPAPGA
jgi:drug/metabolite transporter (DMT)-like permease